MTTPSSPTDPAPRLVAGLLGIIMLVAMLAVVHPAHANEEPRPPHANEARAAQTATLTQAAYRIPSDRPAQQPATQYGVASWYGPGFYEHKTASGERFSRHLATAAHRHLPLGTHVLVTNLKNGRSAVVKINDRGPYVKGRVIDLSPKAAQELAMTHDGLTRVRIQVLD